MKSLIRGPWARCVPASLALVWLSSLPLAASAALSLDQALQQAWDNDPWLQGNRLLQESLESRGVVSGELPDPTLTVGVANLPTDTFAFDQENMTQLRVGISQQFPRGDSRALQRKQLEVMGAGYPQQRADRRAQVARGVSHLWLDAWQARESIRLIEKDRELFEYLVNVVQSGYASAVGKARQQDLIRAQLELTRLEDRLAQLHQDRDVALSRLVRWLAPRESGWSGGVVALAPGAELPALSLARPELLDTAVTTQQFLPDLMAHPAVLGLDQQISAGDVGVELARQKYKPQWGLSASYGYREDDPLGAPRADFFSLGVSFDLPVFTGNRQDREVQSAVASAGAVKTEKDLLLRRLKSGLEAERVRLQRLEQRRALYQTRLLSEMNEQAEASLTAYTNDDGDFAEAVRARIDELNARIDALDIEVERLKSIASLNYFFAPAADVEGESS